MGGREASGKVCEVCGSQTCGQFPEDFPIHKDYPFLPDDDPQKRMNDPKPDPEPRRGRRK